MFESFMKRLWKHRGVATVTDPTIYLIVTKTREYQGLIVHQDGLMINFKDAMHKHIKILKANIITIKIIEEPLVQVKKPRSPTVPIAHP